MEIINKELSSAEEIVEIKNDSIIRSVFVGRGEDIVKSKIIYTHKIPNIKSRIEIKAVLYDKSKFDFEGILKIEKGASGTDTYLKIDCLVLSDHASARAIPSLEINESEVKGGHGATIGYLDPEIIHYLKSRGISQSAAEELIVDSFLKPFSS